MNHPTNSTRRRFLRNAAASLTGGLALPLIIPRHVLGAADQPGANERIGLGMIGAGRRTHQILGDVCRVTGTAGDGQVVAVSDIWPKKSAEWLEAYAARLPDALKRTDIPTMIDYRELLDRNDVDAVIVTTCDHWHALPAIHACQAGKDVYGEKPLALTIAEGRAMVSAVRKYERMFQTGAQQRSYLRNRQGCELIRNGKLGQITEVRCVNYGSAKPASAYELPTEPVPDGMDWERWCGQTDLAPFSFNRYLTYEKPGWQWIREHSGGLLTNWGAHGLDMVQWALGTDDTGPVEIIPEGNQPNSKVSFRYASGVIVRLNADSDVLGGGHFIGTEGEMFMNRGKFNTVPIAISQQEIGEGDLRLYHSDDHMQNWLDCIRSRKMPVSDVEVGHRSATLCHLCGIARWLGRPLRWDPEKETFPDDDEANGYLDRPKRAPYQLPDPV
jgi:predicted dehydrogenase